MTSSILHNCTLCPRRCGADRAAGKTGYCKQTASLRVARSALHFWEEPCISGNAGSGAVFFAGCPLRCVFCQNYKIAVPAGQVSDPAAATAFGRPAPAISIPGVPVTVSELADRFLSLQAQGAHNINLVTPTHFVPLIADALRLARSRDLVLPVVYNTSSYEAVKTLRLLDGLIDIYLPDLKYRDPALSARYSNAPDYFSVASAAIAEMYRQVGPPVFEEVPLSAASPAAGSAAVKDTSSAPAEADANTDGPVPLLKRGMIVRHMVLPGQTEDSKSVLKYLYHTYGDDIFLSIMNQYTPIPDNPRLTHFPELLRKVTQAEYDAVVDYAIDLGIENGFIQEGPTQDESFVPAWEYEASPSGEAESPLHSPHEKTRNR